MRCVSKLNCGQTSGAAFGERYRHINGVLIETAQKVGIDLWTLDVLWWRHGQADGPAVDFDDSDDEEGATEPGARFGLWRRLNRPTLGWTAAPRSFTRWRRARPMCMTRPAWGSCCTVKRPGSGATRPIRDKERSFATAPPNAQDMTHRRCWRNGVVDERERARNRAKSRVRARVEHPFLVIKRMFGIAKTRYRGLDKNSNRLFVTCALTNLYLLRRRLLCTT